MVGMSAFFAGSFHNLFITQQKLSDTQGQFSLNEIIRNKLTDVKSIIEQDVTSVWLQNNLSDGQLPFTYIKQDGEKLVFKDFFIFNGLVGSTSSADYTDVSNPAGITNIGTDYYITAPLENKIYVCSPTCTALSVSGLNQPTGITTNGTDTLFVSDSGNNRVIKINPLPTPSVEADYIVLSKNLNYPTGLALYSGNQLFISDTYNNRIIKIQTNFPPSNYPLSESELIIIAGDGDDTTCTGTAKYCKLTFPTGLAVDGNTLYVADTGSNRILKITDPQPDLDAYEVNFDLGSIATQISQINFSFPTATSLKNPPSITNDLHAGRYNTVGTTYAYLLSTPILNGDVTLPCGEEPDPSSSFCFERFKVSDENNLFLAGDGIFLGTDPFTVDSITPPNDVYVIDKSKTTGYPAGTIAKVTNNFSGAHNFTFDFDEENFSPGFHNVNVEIFDGTDTSIKKVSQTFAIGNGILGTDEDRIEVYDDTDLPYPTGLGFGISGLSISATPIFSTDEITSFDYTSDFDIDTLSFAIINAGDGEVLETTIVTDAPEEADKKTYTLNAALE